MDQNDSIYKLYANKKLKKSLKLANRMIEVVNNNVYKNILFVSNDVLSRNPYGNKFLEHLYQERSFKTKIINYLFGIILFYVKNSIYFFIWFLQLIAFKISGLKCRVNNSSREEHTVIDTFFLFKNLKRSVVNDNIYLKGLDNLLDENLIKFSYLPVFVGEKNPFLYYKFFKQMKTSRYSYITEYELLSLYDYVQILKNILVYPFMIITLALNIGSRTKARSCLQYELINTLNQQVFLNFIRYRVGIRLNERIKRLKVISWCENQTGQKNLYRGIRDSGGESFVIGCYFFLQYSNWLNLNIAKHEYRFGCAPDLILTNGSCQLNDFYKIPSKPGVSLRYLYLFHDIPANNSKEDGSILLLLSYLEDESLCLLSSVKSAALDCERIYVKPHPVLNLRKVQPYCVGNWRCAEGALDEYFNKCDIAFCIASGSAVEALVRGLSVILVGNIKDGGIDAIPFMALGKGVVWDIVYDVSEIRDVYNKLIGARVSKATEIHEISKIYKKLLFNNLSNNEFLEALEYV